MLAGIYLIVIGMLAQQVRSRFALLHSFRGLPGYALSFGLTLFLANWVNFLLYALLGWGAAYLALSWVALALAVIYLASTPPCTAADAASAAPAGGFRDLLAPSRWNFWFLFLAAAVLARFYAGIDEDGDGQIWVVFNFVDTAFHLSVTNAFLESTRFPPMDLDLAPFPLKYHFLADFLLAHLVQLGLPALKGVWTMNLLSAATLVGTVWAMFERWLKLPPRWIMLAGFIFLFLNTTLVNLLHYWLLKPGFFDPQHLFDGVLRFPYFNFESSLYNLFEPQRALLFTMPVLLFVLHLAFGEPPAGAGADAGPERTRTLVAFILICLLPFGHIVGFIVLALCLLPAVWRHRQWLLTHHRCWWLGAFLLGALQLYYLFCYGPPAHPRFSAWDATDSIPLRDFAPLPEPLRRSAFWFFVDGDYFFWGLVLAGVALLRCRRARRAATADATFQLWEFLRQWRWYFAVCGGLFLLINYYRYSFTWADSNKFVLFLNLGLSLVIALGAAQWIGQRRRGWSQALWLFFLGLAVVPPSYGFYRRVIRDPLGNNLFFHRHEIVAAQWLKEAAGPADFVLTAAYTDSHFVTALAAQPTPAGIYGDSNLYRQPGRREAIRRIYENGELSLLSKLNARYICISRAERHAYKLSRQWLTRAQTGAGVAFHDGRPDEFESVFIFDTQALIPASSDARGRGAR